MSEPTPPADASGAGASTPSPAADQLNDPPSVSEPRPLSTSSSSASQERDRDRDRERDRHRSSRDRDSGDRHHRERDRDRDRGERKRSRRSHSRSRSRSPSHRSSKPTSAASSSSRTSHPSSRSRSPRRTPPPPLPHSSDDSRSPISERERAELTVFVSQVHPKIKERDLFEFFSLCGRVEDVRLIRDAKTRRSKGLGYVEFRAGEEVLKALALSGQLLGGYPISVQAVQLPHSKEVLPSAGIADGLRLYVGSLQYQITEADIRPIFEALGPIDSIEVHKDPATGIRSAYHTPHTTVHTQQRQTHLLVSSDVPLPPLPLSRAVAQQRIRLRPVQAQGGRGDRPQGSAGSGPRRQTRQHRSALP